MKTLTIDPVCGVAVSASSRFHVEHEGTSYVFCSEKCKARFKHDPGEFIYPEGMEVDVLLRNLELNVHEPVETPRHADHVFLFLIPGMAALVALARQMFAPGYGDWVAWFADVTGFFLVLLSAFKFGDLTAFATGFQSYDLLGRIFPTYAYIYPFVELALGFTFLTGHFLRLASVVTISVMIFGSLGIFISMRGGYRTKVDGSDSLARVPVSTAELAANLCAIATAALVCWTAAS